MARDPATINPQSAMVNGFNSTDGRLNGLHSGHSRLQAWLKYCLSIEAWCPPLSLGESAPDLARTPDQGLFFVGYAGPISGVHLRVMA